MTRLCVTISIVLVALGIFIGLVVAQTIDSSRTPKCPTEDSCTIDYRDGGWKITERQ